MDLNFPESLIKGKITESIFELMFREAGKFEIIPIGYEHTTPELAQYQHQVHVKQVLNNLRDAPDFALVSSDKKSVYLVEVKYRKKIDFDYLVPEAEKIHLKYNPCYFFTATPDGFYFDSCSNIISHQGFLTTMDISWVNHELQIKYLKLLNKFITPS
jgi:hypothetical protein